MRLFGWLTTRRVVALFLNSVFYVREEHVVSFSHIECYISRLLRRTCTVAYVVQLPTFKVHCQHFAVFWPLEDMRVTQGLHHQMHALPCRPTIVDSRLPWKLDTQRKLVVKGCPPESSPCSIQDVVPCHVDNFSLPVHIDLSSESMKYWFHSLHATSITSSHRLITLWTTMRCLEVEAIGFLIS